MGDKPKAPTYDMGAAQKEQERLRNEARKDQYVNYSSPLGGYSWNPTTGTIDVSLNNQDRERLGLIGSGLANIDMDPNEAADNYFQNTMRNLQPEIDRYVSQVNANLVNKGIPVGSRAYNQVQEEVDKNIAQQLNNAYVDSRSRALSDMASQINNVGGLQSQIYQPQVYAGIGATGLSDLYNNKFQNEMDVYNSKVGSRNSTLGSVMGLVGTGIGAYFGGPWGAAAGGSAGSALGNSL